MLRYFIRRLVTAIPVIVGITIFTFTLAQLAPGDPAAAYVDMESFSEEALNAARERLGLNDPLPVQYVRWLGLTLQGDLGRSLITRKPVGELITHRLWNTISLTAASLILSTLVGLAVGVISAVYQYSTMDYLFTIVSFAAVSVPGFFLALVFIYIFALRLNWLPTSGMFDLRLPADATTWERTWDSIKHYIMPVIALSAPSAAPLARYARSSMLEVLNQDYLQTARAKGARERRVIWRHAFPNALLPIITVVALRLPFLFGGSVIIEQIFQWQGLGSMSVKAVLDSDYPIIMAVNLIFAVLVLASNLLADMLYAVADPRVRYD
ncbi:MAG: ABC transporter permease [Anaerolineae bacterium]|nr:ABC transporter permease [Anaerolineae bacterium]